MSQSLYTAMGGIAAAQTGLNVVANNIANLNTTGFKESKINFEDVFYTTLSSGNPPTAESGGTNPVQIGLGTQVGAISKNFDAGTWVSTGKTTDLMIEGTGFFCARSSDGEIYLTRAGNFTFDAAGDLVTAGGYKILGTDQLLTSSSSTTPVHIPQSIVTQVTPNEDFNIKNTADLNNCALTLGTFFVTITDNAGNIGTPIEVTLDAADNTMQKICTKIQNTIDATVTPPAVSGVTVVCNNTTNGTVKFQVNGTQAAALSFTPGTSNFVSATQLGKAVLTGGTYTSGVLDYKVDVGQVTSLDNATTIASYSISKDGSIAATYSNGDTITVELGADAHSFLFKYTTSTGVIIRGADAVINTNVAVPANFQIQLGNVVNPDGLITMGGNLYNTGANSGEMYFTIGSAMGLGSIASGGLEASNVDLSKQFSDMILQQRAIQANSRTFSTTSEVMQTIVSLGR